MRRKKRAEVLLDDLLGTDVSVKYADKDPFGRAELTITIMMRNKLPLDLPKESEVDIRGVFNNLRASHLPGAHEDRATYKTDLISLQKTDSGGLVFRFGIYDHLGPETVDRPTHLNDIVLTLPMRIKCDGRIIHGPTEVQAHSVLLSR
jgi:hypothetical protein